MKRLIPIVLGLVFLNGFATAQSAFDPASTLFLTWTADPCTTMAVQWLQPGDLPAAVPGSASGDDMAHRIPHLENIEIDGRDQDWGDAGFRLDYLGRPSGGWPDPAGSSATAKVGWSGEALLVWVNVVDDKVKESRNESKLDKGDSVELFLADAWDGSASVQVIVAPGIDRKQPKLRTQVLDRRGVKGLPLVVKAAAQKTKAGYAVEIALPWAGLMDARPGAMPAMQLIVNDVGGASGRRRKQLAWFPGLATRGDLSQMKRLVLGATPESPQASGDPVRASAVMRRADKASKEKEGIAFGEVMLDISGEPELIGKEVQVRSGTHTLATVTLGRAGGFAKKVVALPEPPTGKDGASQRWSAVTVHLNDRVLASAMNEAVWRTLPAPRKGTAVSSQGLRHEAASEVAPFGNTGLFRQRMTFRGLAPAGSYVCTVERMPEVFSFDTAPETLEVPMVFAEGGDIGTDQEYVAPLHRAAASWDPLFGLVGGDLAYANGKDEKAWVQYLQLWNAHMRTPTPAPGSHLEKEGAGGAAPVDRLIPMLVTIGNHEVIGMFGKQRHHAPFFFTLFDGLFAKHSYATLDFGGSNAFLQGEKNKANASGVPPYLSLVLMDSGHTAKVAGRQTDWLAEQLAARDRVRHLFMAYHVPAYPSFRNIDDDSTSGEVIRAIRKLWVPLFQEHGVDIAFEHHDHAYKRALLKDHAIVEPGTPGAVLYLGDGSWGKGGRGVKPYGYLEVSESKRNVLRIEVRPDGSQHFSAVDVAGEVFDEGTHHAP